jgi:hypothetical protein
MGSASAWAAAEPTRRPASGTVTGGPRGCDCGWLSRRGSCEPCEHERAPSSALRQAAIGPTAADPRPMPDAAGRVLQSAGEPLDPGTRRFMESRIGHDFSAVRVHADADAAASARAVAAKAYTLGQDVVFAAGRYEPRSSEGQRLLAHELTHVVQQADAPPLTGTARIAGADAFSEQEAHRAADRVADGGAVPMIRQAGPMLLQTEDDPAELRRQLAALEKRAAKPVSLSQDEVAAIQSQRDALRERLAAAVRASSRPASGAAASSTAAVSTALPAAAEPSPAAAGENPTPESMVRQVVEQRLFTSVPPTREGGIPPIPAGALAEGTRGQAAGPGYQTNAALKVEDAQGHQVAFELAQYAGGDNPHAEAQGVARLRLRLAGRTFPGGRLVVAVDQAACGGCLARLRALAVDLGVGSYEIWAPTPQEGRTAGIKWTARTAATAPARPSPAPVSETPGGAAYRYEARLIQGESFTPGPTPPSSVTPGPTSPARPGAQPETTAPPGEAASPYRLATQTEGPARPSIGSPIPAPKALVPAGEPSIPAPVASPKAAFPIGEPAERTRYGAREAGPEVHPGPRGMGLRSGPSHLTVTAVSLGISLAGDLLTSWLLSRLEKAMAESPPLTVEAGQLWMSQDFGGRTELELIAAGLPDEVEAVREAPSRRVGPLLAFWAQLDRAPARDHGPLLDEAIRQLTEDRRQLLVAADNVANALGSEQRLAEKAQAAEDLHRFLSIELVYGGLVTRTGLKVEQLEQVRLNLSWYSAAVRRRVIAPLHELAPLLRAAINADNRVLLQLERARTIAEPRINMPPLE